MDVCRSGHVVVVKLGGSVLIDDESYREAARFLVRRLHRCAEDRFLIVVSAQNGTTDKLEQLARGITANPNPRTLDLLWSTGEMRSVALLTLRLEEVGVRAVGLNIHEMGLQLNEFREARPAGVVPRLIERALEEYSAVVVPGFFGTKDGAVIASLGRGGSDLSAVLLAGEFDATECELVKDVSGYFTENPDINPNAKHLPRISYEAAVEMAARGCELVQHVALEAARERGLQLIVRGLDDAVPGTVVSSDASQIGQRNAKTVGPR